MAEENGTLYNSQEKIINKQTYRVKVTSFALPAVLHALESNVRVSDIAISLEDNDLIVIYKYNYYL